MTKIAIGIILVFKFKNNRGQKECLSLKIPRSNAAGMVAGISAIYNQKHFKE